MQRLAALVPRPRLHLIRVHGVLAPNAKLRSKVVPTPPQQTTTGEGEGEGKHERSAPLRMTWARLMKHVFDIDVEQCACGGKLRRRENRLGFYRAEAATWLWRADKMKTGDSARGMARDFRGFAR